MSGWNAKRAEKDDSPLPPYRAVLATTIYPERLTTGAGRASSLRGVSRRAASQSSDFEVVCARESVLSSVRVLV